MSVYIKGMEMPTCGHTTIRIYADGTVEHEHTDRKLGTAVPVPAHGRLIDADALIAAHEQVCPRSMKFNLDLAPTIIPAEEGET